MPNITLHSSVEQIGRATWDGCFLGALESYDYLRATEQAGIHGFEWGYIIARNDKQIIAAMPAFFTRYHLDTTLDPCALRRFIARIKKIFPKFFSLKLACLGSPVTEFGEIGFHPSVKPEDRAALITEMLAQFETHARQKRYGLLAVKDYPPMLEPAWEQALRNRDFQSVNGLPIAQLAIDFADMDAYFAKLSHATRKDMRRKLKRRGEVRTEIVTEFSDALLPRIMQLYYETHARAEMQFETLTAEFFRDIMASNPGRAFCVLYYIGDQLLAFNLLLRDGRTLLDKFFCMDATAGREFNLYFLSWFVNIEYCLANKLTQFQSGAAGYSVKLRLGSRLEPTAMAYRHTNLIIHALLRLAAPLLEPENPLEEAP